MRLHIIIAAAAVLGLATTPAFSDTSVGWYVAADAGYNKVGLKDLDITDVVLGEEELISGGESSSSYSYSSYSYYGESGSQSSEGPSSLPDAYDMDARDGTALFTRIGYRFNPEWRVELEHGARVNDVSFIDGQGFSEAAPVAKNRMDQDSLMLNLIYDLEPEKDFHPFVGVGVGSVRAKIDYSGVTGPVNGYDQQTVVIKDKGRFTAYQAIAGVTWALSDRFNLDIIYRYMHVPDATFDAQVTRQYTSYYDNCGGCYYDESKYGAVAYGASGPATVEGGYYNTATYRRTDTERLDTSYYNQSLTVGLRWTFAAPPPPAPTYVAETVPPGPPPPAMAERPLPMADSTAGAKAPQAKEFLVHFAFDSAALTPEGQATVSEAADYAVSNNASQVAVIGHTDTSGSAAYNIRLSQRRAQTVADGLVAQGVNPAIIGVDWKGESQPAVTTGNGVKSAANRRVTIGVFFHK